MQITTTHNFLAVAENNLAIERRKKENKHGAMTWDKYIIRGTAKTGFKLVQQGRLK